MLESPSKNSHKEARLLEIAHDPLIDCQGTVNLSSSRPQQSNMSSGSSTNVRRRSISNAPNPQPSADLPTKAQPRKFKSKIPVRSVPPLRARSKSTGHSAFHFFTPENVSSGDESDTDHLKDEELKQKLREEKRHGKKTGELLTQLQENYKELLEKYAQAENTIDQLRFQPKFTGENQSTSESTIHQIQPTRFNVRSNGIHPSASITPLSSTTPLMKSLSPVHSATTLQSIVIDEDLRQSKLDLIHQSKTFGEKMKSFLTLMDANQLSLIEQKQVFDSIKQDYERLIQSVDKNKSSTEQDDVAELESDLNRELATMKQLLKEIVQQFTQNLREKSLNNSRNERQIARTTHDESSSSQLSVRSSLYNHEDLMDQYQKILTAVNTRPNILPPVQETRVLYPTPIPSSQSSSTVSPRNERQKAYVYVSGDSDNDQQEVESDRTTPIPIVQGLESIPFELESLQTATVQQINQEQRHIQGTSTDMKRSNRPEPRIDHRPERYFHSSTSIRTYGATDHDSGLGTTKYSQERVNNSTIDESHSQTLLHVDRESHSSASSASRMSASVSQSPMRFNHHPKRSPKSRMPMNNHENPIHRSYHTWRPRKPEKSNEKRFSCQASTSTKRSSRYMTYRDVHPRAIVSIEPMKTIYRSSLYINPTQGTLSRNPSNHLYLDPRTGIIYQYESHSIVEPRPKQYRCHHCGTISNYHHHHPIRTDLDDPGYESEQRHTHYTTDTSSSSSDDSDTDTVDELIRTRTLNEVYERAEKIEQESKVLSRSIRRSLQMVFAQM